MTQVAVVGLLSTIISIFSMQTAAQLQLGQNLHRGSKNRHANFVEHPRTILNVSLILSTKENRAMSCAFTCMANIQCYSYNVGVSPDAKNMYECQLLATDKYNSSSNLRSSDEFNHYSIQSHCEALPCQNGGTCRAAYETEHSYRCDCTTEYGGNHCQYPKSCRLIKQTNPNAPDGLYQLPDTSNHGNPFPTYCDMTSFGGGWTMCYTTNEFADPKDETTYSNSLPYGTNGYRTNCNDIEFSEIIFIDEQTKQKEYFSRISGQKIKLIESYSSIDAAPQGLWNSHGLAHGSYSYQVIICDNYFYSGIHVSGYTVNCYKKCDNWCGDKVSPYFRTASTNSNYRGVAFNANGHSPNMVPNKLVSVGLR